MDGPNGMIDYVLLSEKKNHADEESSIKIPKMECYCWLLDTVAQ